MFACVGSAANAKLFAWPPGWRPTKTPVPDAQVAAGFDAATFVPSHVPGCSSVCHNVPAGPAMLNRKIVVDTHEPSAPPGTHGLTGGGVTTPSQTTLFAAFEWCTASLMFSAALTVA